MLQQMHDESVILQTVSKFNTFLYLIRQNCMLSFLKILDDFLYSGLQAKMVYFAIIPLLADEFCSRCMINL